MADEKMKSTTEAVASTEPGAADAKAASASAAPAARTKKKKAVKNVSIGRAYVQATYNNTIITLTDNNGNVLGWSSAGSSGFKGPKKSTPYAASIIVKNVCDKVKDYGLKEVSVFVTGVGSGREGAVRALHANGLNVTSIKDITPIPHNGCRAPKPRRI
jgi:small subunit ribosomal protein S11